MMVVNVDEKLEDADWVRLTWPFPDVKTEEDLKELLDELGFTMPQFRKLPVFKAFNRDSFLIPTQLSLAFTTRIDKHRFAKDNAIRLSKRRAVGGLLAATAFLHLRERTVENRQPLTLLLR